MGIKQFSNPQAGLVNRFLRAQSFDSSGTGAWEPAEPSPGASMDPLGHSASGGSINDYATPPGAVFRSHTFTGSGTFTVSALSPTYPATIEFMLIAGGGGGAGWSGYNGGGGGGAGGFRTNMSGHPLSNSSPQPVSTTSYPIVIGAGGAGRSTSPDGNGRFGGTSQAFGYNADGGGGGGYPNGDPGGSGGGGAAPTLAPGAGTGNSPPYSPPQGNPGGHGASNVSRCGGGGGGAGCVGQSAV